MYAKDDKVNNLKIETEKEENFNTNDVSESEDSTLNLIKNSSKVTLAENKESQTLPST
ncbi:2556_t:CDS:2 [Gigaspora margarita]|uniref:2556_t:CDS:1 n=1 Tax=Gigaspora margarita TaxID=4874 RepID=A0ABN7VF35_GIGMA|nr:2556_t:CDS:2 [Gigaspora margarita]